jgi:uncharacterized Ntn-hydrolase superfamily protein
MPPAPPPAPAPVSPLNREDADATLRAALSQFQQRLFQARVSPDKAPIEDVALAFRAWEATVLRDEAECQDKIQHYLDTHHAQRLTYRENYTAYRQSLQQAQQEDSLATLANRLKTRKALVQRLLKPAVLLQRPSTVYTIEK